MLKGFKKFPESSPIYKDYKNPVGDNIRKNVETGMVVHFPADYQYVDTNAKPYGELINSLRLSAVLHMKELYNAMTKKQRTEGTKHTKNITKAIYNMTSQQRFVDKMAKDYWLEHEGTKKRTQAQKQEALRKYNASFTAVQAMFQNLYDKLKLWVQNVKLARGEKLPS